MRKGTAISPDMKKFYELSKQAPKEEPIEEAKEELPKKAGVCWNCGHGSWTMRLLNHFIIRKCKQCGEDQEPIE